MHDYQCPVCESEAGISHRVREMLFGSREEFLYFECSNCGCLSRVGLMHDSDRYLICDSGVEGAPPLSSFRKLTSALQLSSLSFLVKWRKRSELDALRRINYRRNMALLDVGCGSGGLVSELRDLGYHAQGIDTEILRDIHDQRGIRVHRKTLAEIAETFDVILFRRSLERLPIETLKQARERVRKDGHCVVCIALLGWAWRTYATDWAHLNAPRHLVLHSLKSFSLLAKQSGFKIEGIVFDSTEFQIWASDSVQRDIPLLEMPAPTRAQRARMRRLMTDLNRQQQGDTAQFYLSPI